MTVIRQGNKASVKKNNQRFVILITSPLLLYFTEKYIFHSQLSIYE